MNQIHNTVTSLLGELNSLRRQERCYFSFKITCNKIERLIRSRIVENENSSRNNMYIEAASALAHTTGKEVGYIESHQDRMHKKNAAKVRTNEYYEAVDDAYDRVRSDILMVLIEEREELEKQSLNTDQD